MTCVTLRITVSYDWIDPAQSAAPPLRARRREYEQDDASGVNAEHLGKLRDILAQLDAARSPGDMNLLGFGFHPLKGKLKGFYAVTVRANWRVIFRFVAGASLDVDLVDYH